MSAAKKSDVASEVVFLGKLVEQIVSGRIRVPRFQRAFVWGQRDLLDLLDSVFRGFPIGAILVWDTDQEITSTERIGPVQVDPPPQGTVGYLLDGQQRVSALVGTLRLVVDPPDAPGPSIAENLDWRVYCDLESGEFLRTPRQGVEPRHFPVRSLLNTQDFFASCRRIEQQAGDPTRKRKWLGEADRLASAFRDYQLPLIRIRDADLDSAVAVFARLNRTGRKMAADEMVSALTYEEGGFHLASAFSEFKRELGSLGFGNLDRVLLLRSVLAALDLDVYATDWANLVVKQDVRARLPKAFTSATDGLRRALRFLRRRGVTSDRLLPYGLQLVLLGEFFRSCDEPAAETERLLRRWFWVTSFTGWFGARGGAQVRSALREMRELGEGARDSIQVVDFNAPAEPFPERFDGRSARVRAFLLYLCSLDPVSLGDGSRLDTGKLLASRGSDAVGYVVANRGRGHDLFSSPANRMFVDADHTGQALGALRELAMGGHQDSLGSHGFADRAVSLLAGDEREPLIEARLDTLVEGERAFIESKEVAPPTQRIAATVADSATSEEE